MNKRFRHVAIAATIACLVGFDRERAALAEPSVTDKSMAAELFKEGRALLDQDKVAEACRKLEESQRLDPGGGTLLNVAVCHEREGKMASAWVEFTEALGIAKREDRAQRVEFARTHITQIEPLLSRIVIEVPPAADIPDLEVRRDGEVVGRAVWTSPVPVDPGTHVIEASAPGRSSWKQVVSLGAKSDLKTVVVPTLDAAPASASAAGSTGSSPSLASDEAHGTGASASSAGSGAAAASASAGQSSGRSSGSGVVIAGWSAIVLGAAGAGLGTYFAFHAVSLKDDADRGCPSNVCTPAGADSNRSAIQSANYATVAFAVGGAALVTGTLLVALAGHPSEPVANGVQSRGSARNASSSASNVTWSFGVVPTPHGPAGSLALSRAW